MIMSDIAHEGGVVLGDIIGPLGGKEAFPVGINAPLESRREGDIAHGTKGNGSQYLGSPPPSE
jgi:hypothetical protein